MNKSPSFSSSVTRLETRRWLLAAGVAAAPWPAVALQPGRSSSRIVASEATDHTAFDALLDRYAQRGRDGIVRVDYAGWRRSTTDRRALDDYIGALSRSGAQSLTRAEQFAFWANLYNALTLQVVLAAYPIRSIRDVGGSILPTGPWKRRVARVDGVDLSLDGIEHGILRKRWQDPRVHYAVNCASLSCPNLPLRAWRGEGLDGALDAAARDYINHPRGVRFDGGALVVSSIYRWYARDFGGSDAAVIRHLVRYARSDLAARLGTAGRISRSEYDWSLNATASVADAGRDGGRQSAGSERNRWRGAANSDRTRHQTS